MLAAVSHELALLLIRLNGTFPENHIESEE